MEEILDVDVVPLVKLNLNMMMMRMRYYKICLFFFVFLNIYHLFFFELVTVSLVIIDVLQYIAFADD